MRVLLRAPVDRPGVRAVLAELSLMGVDPRIVHRGRGDLLAVGGRDRAWLAAHTAWRDDAEVAHDLSELWSGPEPAPGTLPVAPGRRAVLAPVAAPEDAIALLLDWLETPGAGDDATLVVIAETPGLGLVDAMRSAVDDSAGLMDVVVVERPVGCLATAVADATVVVARPGSAASRLAETFQRRRIAPGLGLARRLEDALASTAAPPTAAQVAAPGRAAGPPARRPARWWPSRAR